MQREQLFIFKLTLLFHRTRYKILTEETFRHSMAFDSSLHAVATSNLAELLEATTLSLELIVLLKQNDLILESEYLRLLHLEVSSGYYLKIDLFFIIFIAVKLIFGGTKLIHLSNQLLKYDIYGTLSRNLYCTILYLPYWPYSSLTLMNFGLANRSR